MQDYDNNSKNNNIRRMPSGEGRPASRSSNGQPRPAGASRPSGQPRQSKASGPNGQPPSRAVGTNGQPRRQAPPDQAKMSRQTASGGQSRTGSQPRRQTPPGRGKTASQPRSAESANPSKSRRQTQGGGQTHSNKGQRSNGNVQTTAKGKGKKKAANKKWKKIVLFIAEIFVLLILVAALWAANKAQQIQYVKIDPIDVHINPGVQIKKEEGTTTMKGYRNIALFGVDSRDKQLDKNTRTDVIMIASINLDTKEVRLVSVYRDTWLNLSDDSYSKANAAYARGGAEQAIGMLNMNLDLDITDFVTVGFDGVIDVVDALGGVEIDVKEEEIVHLNSYQKSMSGRLLFRDENGGEAYDATPGVDYIPVEHAGLQTLNGLQATAYCRIRYTSGGDGTRTERQRAVLTQIARKAMTMNPATLNKIVDSVFGEVSTSLDMSEILELLPDIANYKIGETAGFPFNDHVNMAGRVGKASVVVPIDLTKNVMLLHEFLFDESDYEPTDIVKQCSKKIASDTGISYNGE